MQMTRLETQSLGGRSSALSTLAATSVRLYRGAAVLSSCARTSCVPGNSSVFPKEKEVTCTATFATQTAACGRGRPVRKTSANPAAHCSLRLRLSLKAPLCLLKLSPSLPRSPLQMKAALAVLTESRRRISTLLPPSPRPSLPPVRSLLFPRWLSFSISLEDKPG